MYSVYFAQSLKDEGFYIGVSNNIKRRLAEHNTGLSKSTKYRRPFVIVREEKYDTINEAYKRESYLKKLKSKKLIIKIIKSPDVPQSGNRVRGLR